MSVPEIVYTAEEAAEKLGVTKRALLKVARELGACSKLGRSYLFSNQDLATIWDGMRAEPCHPRKPAVTPQASGAFERLLARARRDANTKRARSD